MTDFPISRKVDRISLSEDNGLGRETVNTLTIQSRKRIIPIHSCGENLVSREILNVPLLGTENKEGTLSTPIIQ